MKNAFAMSNCLPNWSYKNDLKVIIFDCWYIFCLGVGWGCVCRGGGALYTQQSHKWKVTMQFISQTSNILHVWSTTGVYCNIIWLIYSWQLKGYWEILDRNINQNSHLETWWDRTHHAKHCDVYICVRTSLKLNIY